MEKLAQTKGINAADRAGFNKKSVMWNMAGSFMVAGSSFLLLLFVTRTIGALWGGVFSLAYTTAQILLTIGKFGIRSYQSTDIEYKISSDTYFATRIGLSFIMIIIDIIYVFISRYDYNIAHIFMYVCAFKMADALEDVFHGEWQRRGRLDLAGQMLTLRNVITIVTFAVSMYMTYDLLITCLITFLVSVAAVFIVNFRASRGIVEVSFEFNVDELKILFEECFPLFLGSFLSLLIYNIPKYAIDLYLSEEYVTIYTIIFMPTFVINLLSDVIFKPMLTMFAIWWNEGDADKLKKLIIRFMAGVMGLCLSATALAYFIGTMVLSFVYKVDVNAYKTELAILMVAGGLAAIVYLLCNVLTVMRHQAEILYSYGITLVAVLILSFGLTFFYGIRGTAIAYLAAEFFIFGIMHSYTFRAIKNRKNEL